MDLPLCLLKIEELKSQHLALWLQKRDLNPITKRQIEIYGNIYNKLWKQCIAVIGAEKLKIMRYTYEVENIPVKIAPKRSRTPKSTKESVPNFWWPCPQKWVHYDDNQTLQRTGVNCIICSRCGCSKTFSGVHIAEPNDECTQCPKCSKWIADRWYCKHCRGGLKTLE